MNNMRRGFTMIELIFVIVIIGILAAVAIPKLAGVQGQAQVSKILSYAGSLNRTTLPPYWSESLTAGNGGSVKTYSAKILRDLDWPTDFASAPDFANKMVDANASYEFNATTLPSNKLATATINDVTYTLVCVDGKKNAAPKCDVFNATSNKYMLYTSR